MGAFYRNCVLRPCDSESAGIRECGKGFFYGTNFVLGSINPQAAPSLQKQVVAVVYETIAATKLDEGAVCCANALEDFLDNSVFVRLRESFEPVRY